MFRFLVKLIKLLFILSLFALAGLSISDYFFYTNYYSLAEPYYIYIKDIGFIAIIYIIFLFFALIEKIFKKTKIVKSSSKSGTLEVNLETINNLSKDFLEKNKLIKFAKIKTEACFSRVTIYANVETFNTENLNVKLSDLQNELKEYVVLMTGIKVKKVALKITKIDPEKIEEEKVEEKVVEEALSIEKENVQGE